MQTPHEGCLPDGTGRAGAREYGRLPMPERHASRGLRASAFPFSLRFG
jgi:hypothetical protein